MAVPRSRGDLLGHRLVADPARDLLDLAKGFLLLGEVLVEEVDRTILAERLPPFKADALLLVRLLAEDVEDLLDTRDALLRLLEVVLEARLELRIGDLS